MNRVVKTHIIQINGSPSIRIPQFMIEESGLVGEVVLELQQDRIIIRPDRPARNGWVEHFQKMAEFGDDHLSEDDYLLMELDME